MLAAADSLFLLVVGTCLLAGLIAIFYILPTFNRTNKSVAVDSTAKDALRVFTAAEVSKHCTHNDCWIIIKNKVYDVTPYVEEHPGGYAILNHAGGDSTEGFYGPQHASRVFDMVDEFYIGDLIGH